MTSATRPTMSGEAPTEASTLLAKTPTASHDPFDNWEYYLFWFMIICMMVMWSMMILDFFGSGFWVVFNC